MSNDNKQDLERQLEAERAQRRHLEEQIAGLREHVASLEKKLETFQPLAQQWLQEHGPSREECERTLQEMLDHPEKLLNLDDIVRDLEREWNDRKEGEHAA